MMQLITVMIWPTNTYKIGERKSEKSLEVS